MVVLRREYGRVREGLVDDFDVVRESRVHFELLCERYPDSAWVEFRVDCNGRCTVAVEENK